MCVQKKERNANAPEVLNMEVADAGQIEDGLAMVESVALMKSLVIRHHSVLKHVNVPQKNQVCYKHFLSTSFRGFMQLYAHICLIIQLEI